MIIGHFAVSTLLHYYLKVRPTPVLLGGAFPDAVDKTLHQGMGITRSGRTIGHTLFSLTLSSAIVRWLWGPESAKGWAAGYLAHLLCDSDGFIPWFFPFVRYKFGPRPPGSLRLPNSLLSKPTPMEAILVIWMLATVMSKPGRGK